MRVRMLTPIFGPGMVADAGAEIDMPEAEAAGLVAAGLAVPVSEQKPERAVKRGAREVRA